MSTDEEYKISVTGLNGANSYDIFINGVKEQTAYTGSTSYSSNNLSFVDGRDTVLVRIVDLSVGPDTTDIIVHEVLCIDADNDGDMDFNEASCDYRIVMPDIGTIVSTVAPYTGTNVYLYMLTDSAGKLLTTTANYKGHFTELANGEYKVYAYNFLDDIEAGSFLSGLSVGTDMDTIGSNSDPLCYSYCGMASYTVDCECPVTIDTQPNDMTVCEGEDAETWVGASIDDPIPTGATLTYQWELNTGGGFDTLVGETDSLINLPAVTTADSGNMYRVLVTMVVGGNNICTDTSDEVTLHVGDRPELLATLDATVCSDEASGIVLGVSPSDIAADSYNIVAIDSNGLSSSAGSPATGVTSDPNEIADDAWTNTSIGDVIVTYSVSPINGACAGDTIDIELTVQPEPLFTGNLDTMLCADTEIGVILPSQADNGLMIDSFTVSAVVPAGFGTATEGGTVDTNFIASDMYVNTTGAEDTVVYTVTPYAGTCAGESFEIDVIIKTDPLFASNESLTICSGENTGHTIDFSDDNGQTVTSYDITASAGSNIMGTPSEGNGVSDASFILNDVFTNTSSETDSVVYTLTPNIDGCEGDSYTVTVYVEKEPTGSDPMLTVCSDEPFSITLQDLITNASSGTSFEWWGIANGNVTGEPTDTVTTSTISATLTNTTSSTEVVTFRVVPTQGTCVGDTFDITVTVEPEPTADDGNDTVCSGEALDFDLTAQVTNGVSLQGFTYTVDAAPGNNRTDTTTANITDTYVNTTDSNQVYVYTIIPYSSNGCPGDAFTVTVTVQPEPVLDPTLTATICGDSMSTTGITLGVVSGSVAASSYNIVSIDPDGGLVAGAGNASTGTGQAANAISNDIWYNATSGPLTVDYDISPVSADNCAGDTVTITVTIDPTVVVDAGSYPGALCSNADLVLQDLNASMSGGITTGTWSSTTGGSFSSTAFDASTYAAGNDTYTPSATDLDNGFVILTLTSDDPPGQCGAESDTVRIDINDLRCGTFPWDGN